MKSLLHFICITLFASAIAIAPHADAARKPTKKIAVKHGANSAEFVHFSQWKEVTEFIDKMGNEHGFDKAQLAASFDQTRYLESAIQLIKPAPPGKPKNWRAYRARFVENVRIEHGIAFWDKYADALTRAEAKYGVPPEIIVGLIGVETIYGHHTGNFRVLDALTTLAFAYPDTPTRLARMAFFRSELEHMLLLARDSGLDPFSFKGSYAGAIGLPQFMPGSIRKFAVDFDGDGTIDLLASPVDAIGSVANYLALHGWKKSQPMVFPATLLDYELDPATLNAALTQGLKASFSLQEIRTIASSASPDMPEQLLYGLVDLQNGNEPTEYWLATDNFFAIAQYNRSYFYAMSVIDLGKVIAVARTK